MNAQGTITTGSRNKMLRAPSTGPDRKIDKIKDANFKKIIPYPGNIILNIW